MFTEQRQDFLLVHHLPKQSEKLLSAGAAGQRPGRMAGEIAGGLVAMAECLDSVVFVGQVELFSFNEHGCIGSQEPSLFILLVENTERAQSTSSTTSRPSQQSW